MKFNYQPYEYEQIYRPIYEFQACLVWLLGIIVLKICNYYIFMSSNKMDTIQTGIFLIIALYLFCKGYHIYALQSKLLGTKLEFIDLKAFIKRVSGHIKRDEFYLGQGFLWTPVHTQRAYEILKLNWSELSRQRTLAEFIQTKIQTIKRGLKGVKGEGFYKGLNTVKALFIGVFSKLPEKHEMGQKWIHGLNSKTKDLNIPASWFNGHLLILGTTGSGKTRLADLLCTQCIMRGESLVIIDPKGDREMLTNARNAARAYREYIKDTTGEDPGNNFFYFHPADPEHSVRINLLANSSRDTDIATRITNLIPTSNGGFDPFIAFGWLSINAIILALLYLGRSPTINEIKLHLLDNMEQLTTDAVDAFCTQTDLQEIATKGQLLHKPFDELVKERMRMAKGGSEQIRTTIKCDIFNELYKTAPNATNIVSLIKLRNHPREHFSKMINNMLPLLDMLTTGTLNTMLSMSEGDDPNMSHNIINTMDILDRKGVLYIGLDSLSDKIVGNAIGSLALSDITATAGAIYNFAKDKPPVNIFVDEAAECVNDSFIQALNKGRGAGFRLIVATQTISDFTAALGSQAKEEMVLGNVNNIIALRTTSASSQEFLANKLPKTMIKMLTHTQGLNSLTTQPLLHGATQSEQLKETEAPLIAPQIFGLLANLEYIAIFAGGTIAKGKLPLLVAPKLKVEKYKGVKDDFSTQLDIDKDDDNL